MRLRRVPVPALWVFNIDITECEQCQKLNVTIIACITDVFAINKILAHLAKKYPLSVQTKTLLPPLRAPPDTEQQNFDWVSPVARA